MAEETGTLERIAEGLANALTELSDLAQPANLAVLLNDLGIDSPPDLSGDAQLAQSLNDVVTRATELTPRIEALILAAEEGGAVEIATAGAAVLAQSAAVGTALDAAGARLQAALATIPEGPELAAELAKRVIGDAIARYLDAEHPLLRRVLTLATVLEWDVVIPETDDSVGLIRRRLHVERLPKLLSDPLELLESGYGWGHDDFDASRLLQRIGELFDSLDPIAVFGDEEGPPVPPVLDFGTFTLEPIATAPPGLAGELFLEAAENAVFTLAQLSEEGSVVLRLDGGFGEGLTVQLVPPTRLEITPPPSGTLEARVALEAVGRAADPTHPILLLGITGASRIEAQSISAGVEARGSWSLGALRADVDVGIRAIITGGRVLVSPAGGDGFLTAVLPRDRMQLDFDLEVGWSSTRGLQIEGGAGLEITIPVYRPLGPILLESVNIGGSVESRALVLTAGITARVKLGPFETTIEGVGMRADFAFPGSGGNLGPIDVDIGFKTPTGVGLSIDGGGFKGGGFLSFDPENESYTGALQLQFRDKFVVNAVGILTTRLPDARKGFSLLIMISSEFSPVQLGLGFTLNGVGGLLGVNRTAKVEALRTGLRDNTLDGLLFPADPVTEAPRLIRDLERVFPARRARHLFGPIGKLGWGTPMLVTADIGLVLEVPEPIRLLFFGVLRAKLPKEDKVLLRLQVNFLGELNFEREEFSFDAHLFDSRLAQFSLDGDMAVRIKTGDNANLLLTVGGFHPGYTPPPLALPQLSRVQIKLLDSDNPNLRLEGYFAITSNSVQIGAAVELLAKASKFNVYGFIGFDGLFQLAPFRFVVLVNGTLAARIGTRVLFGVGLEMTLEGPAPFRAAGAAKIKFWFITIRVRFDFTFGDVIAVLLAGVDLLVDLLEALADPGNWQTTLPPRVQPLVAMRDTSGESELILVQPMGFLQIAQKVVPLGLEVDRVGGARPTGERRFTLGDVTAQGKALATETVREQFAPAQFFDLSDAERVSSKSFERYEAGVQAGEREVKADYAVPRDVKYERVIIDRKGRRERLSVVAQPLSVFEPLLRRNAAARSPLAAQARFASADPPQVTVEEEGFTVVQVDDLRPADPSSTKKSEQEARDHLRTLLDLSPSLVGKLQIVPAYEAEAA